ncbi:hypothetical protein A616_16110 [Brevibacillus brevis X23]|nr:hypothetical protein A616_16110 [Brevibacillus brevis X23]
MLWELKCLFMFDFLTNYMPKCVTCGFHQLSSALSWALKQHMAVFLIVKPISRAKDHWVSGVELQHGSTAFCRLFTEVFAKKCSCGSQFSADIVLHVILKNKT